MYAFLIDFCDGLQSNASYPPYWVLKKYQPTNFIDVPLQAHVKMFGETLRFLDYLRKLCPVTWHRINDLQISPYEMVDWYKVRS